LCQQNIKADMGVTNGTSCRLQRCGKKCCPRRNRCGDSRYLLETIKKGEVIFVGLRFAVFTDAALVNAP
jgi:hypothetical protein